MKKISYFSLLLTVPFLIYFSSCRKTDLKKENIQITSRLISFSILGTSFTSQLNEKLYNEVLDGKIKAYRYDSITASCMFSAEEIKSISTIEESVQYRPDSSQPDLVLDTVLKQVFKTSDIVGYSIAEKWIPDRKGNKNTGEILAFAINWKPSIAGIQLRENPLFWVDYKDVIKLLNSNEADALENAIYKSLVDKLNE